MWGTGVPGTAVFAIDGTPNRPYAIVLAGSLQEQTVLGLQVHVDLSWLFATTAVPGFLGALDASGNAMVSVPVPNLPALHAVKALPTGEVFAGGDSGLFVRFDGSGWSEPKSRTSIPLRALSFQSTTSGWAVGITNLVMRYEPE